MATVEAMASVRVDLIRRALERGRTVQAEIHSGSMSPMINSGDLVKIARISPEALDNGDIVAYNAYGDMCVHRVISRPVPGDGPAYLVTKGDGNGTADTNPVPVEDIIGRVEMIIRAGGAAVRLTTTRARCLARLTAGLSRLSGIIWAYRNEQAKCGADRVGKVLVRPVGAVARRAYLILDRLTLRICAAR